MARLQKYLALLELGYLVFGMVWLNWSALATIAYLLLGLIVYYPFGLIYIALAKGEHKIKAGFIHIFFYGFGLITWTFIMLIAQSMAASPNWGEQSAEQIFNSILIFVLISSFRHILNLILEKNMNLQRTVVEAFYIGVWKLLFMFAVMSPTVIVIMLLGNRGATIISFIVVALSSIWEIKNVGRRMTTAEYDSLGKRIGLVD